MGIIFESLPHFSRPDSSPEYLESEQYQLDSKSQLKLNRKLRKLDKIVRKYKNSDDVSLVDCISSSNVKLLYIWKGNLVHIYLDNNPDSNSIFTYGLSLVGSNELCFRIDDDSQIEKMLSIVDDLIYFIVSGNPLVSEINDLTFYDKKNRCMYSKINDSTNRKSYIFEKIFKFYNDIQFNSIASLTFQYTMIKLV